MSTAFYYIEQRHEKVDFMFNCVINRVNLLVKKHLITGFAVLVCTLSQLVCGLAATKDDIHYCISQRTLVVGNGATAGGLWMTRVKLWSDE